MALTDKLRAATQFLDGSRNITDLGVFWSRPRGFVGGELTNRAGLQLARAAYQRATHRPNADLAPPALRDDAEHLIDSGMIVLPDFLPRDVFEKVREEHAASFGEDHDAIRSKTDDSINKSTNKYVGSSEAVNSVEIRGVRQESRKVIERLAPTALDALVNNRDIWALASAAMGKRVKYRPGAYFQREVRAAGAETDTEQNIILHEDVFYPSIKVFYYINDNTVENGAFIVVPKTQRLDRQRLMHEYLYSVDIARQKGGKDVSHPVHESGRMQVFGKAYRKEDLDEVQAVGRANTLVIANTMAFHRRGGSALNDERNQLRMCFRHVETWHHFLYPYFNTESSERLKHVSYY